MPKLTKRRGKRWIKHIHQEGSRNHVIWWSEKGRHCSEANCEVNKIQEIPRRIDLCPIKALESRQ